MWPLQGQQEAHVQSVCVRSDSVPDQAGGEGGAPRYADSIESLVRNSIQQVKIDMANEVIDAGRFDMHTSMDERRQTLEEMLQVPGLPPAACPADLLCALVWPQCTTWCAAPTACLDSGDCACFGCRFAVMTCMASAL